MRSRQRTTEHLLALLGLPHPEQAALYRYRIRYTTPDGKLHKPNSVYDLGAAKRAHLQGMMQR